MEILENNVSVMVSLSLPCNDMFLQLPSRLNGWQVNWRCERGKKKNSFEGNFKINSKALLKCINK